MQAQGELLRKEMEAQEARQRSAIEDLMEAIDVRAQVAELGEDVRCLEGARSLKKKHPKIMIFQKTGASRTHQSAMRVRSSTFGLR